MSDKNEGRYASSVAVPRRTHILSVDVKDYFMVEAFADSVVRSTWENWPYRVVGSIERVLDLFDECNVKGTFFFLGWVAKKFPALVREAHTSGHELACHSYWHRTVYSLTPEEFREDTRAAVRPIEDTAGEPRINGGLKSRVRHYTNLKQMKDRLRHILRKYEFSTFSALMNSEKTELNRVKSESIEIGAAKVAVR